MAHGWDACWETHVVVHVSEQRWSADARHLLLVLLIVTLQELLHGHAVFAPAESWETVALPHTPVCRHIVSSVQVHQHLCDGFLSASTGHGHAPVTARLHGSVIVTYLKTRGVILDFLIHVLLLLKGHGSFVKPVTSILYSTHLADALGTLYGSWTRNEQHLLIIMFISALLQSQVVLRLVNALWTNMNIQLYFH